jgi:hypothetical protein
MNLFSKIISHVFSSDDVNSLQKSVFTSHNLNDKIKFSILDGGMIIRWLDGLP